MSLDPTETNPNHYKVIFENDRVRVLAYTDEPGTVTTPHAHPDRVMYTLSSFRRQLVQGDVKREVQLHEGTVGWLPAQEHHGENIGETPTHAIFVGSKVRRARPPKAGSARASDSVLVLPVAQPSAAHSREGVCPTRPAEVRICIPTGQRAAGRRRSRIGGLAATA